MTTYRIEEALLRDILAAVGFMFADDLPPAARETLAQPSQAMLDALSALVELRRHRGSA